MANIMRLSSLIPTGLVVESAAEDDVMMVVSTRSVAERRACPLCGRFSGHVDSRYIRTIADLPVCRQESPPSVYGPPVRLRDNVLPATHLRGAV